MFAAVSAFPLAAEALGDDAEDFPPRPISAYAILSPRDGERVAPTVIGAPRSYVIGKADTLLDIARRAGLGINEIVAAFPEIDRWVPPVGETIALPTSWITPLGPREGIVVNVPEMRLYYYPPTHESIATVVTYPVGLGRGDWQTPLGSFRITEKSANPAWVIPESIRKERIREQRGFARSIPGGDPRNPLGRYRLRLSLPEYAIHGTNMPWGVGMQVSHGCIRLYPEDIERLYPLVPFGTTGRIVYQPVKIGARGEEFFVEVHPDIYDTGFDHRAEAQRMLDELGWRDRVDPERLESAIERQSGVPTAISVDDPFRVASQGAQSR